MPPTTPPAQARVIVVAGPSGSGKSRLTRRLGIPAINLDDFYKDGDDPTLPIVDIAGGDPAVDWDSPESWNAADAMHALTTFCARGEAEVPTYDIATSRRTGMHSVSLDGSHLVIAEGIFAQEIVTECRRLGVLADAVCVTQHPAITFVRRFTRDLREHRKPPFFLLRRGLHLALAQRRIVERARSMGCRVVDGDTAYRELSGLL